MRKKSTVTSIQKNSTFPQQRSTVAAAIASDDLSGCECFSGECFSGECFSGKSAPSELLPCGAPGEETLFESDPPWVDTRTVVQGVGSEGKEYSDLKKRLYSIPTRKKQKRQRLYRDSQTRQYWLGLTVSMTHLFERLEVLKPLPVDTAESLLA